MHLHQVKGTCRGICSGNPVIGHCGSSREAGPWVSLAQNVSLQSIWLGPQFHHLHNEAMEGGCQGHCRAFLSPFLSWNAVDFPRIQLGWGQLGFWKGPGDGTLKTVFVSDHCLIKFTETPGACCVDYVTWRPREGKHVEWLSLSGAWSRSDSSTHPWAGPSWHLGSERNING